MAFKKFDIFIERKSNFQKQIFLYLQSEIKINVDILFSFFKELTVKIKFKNN
jgi:hypothetical protein